MSFAILVRRDNEIMQYDVSDFAEARDRLEWDYRIESKLTRSEYIRALIELCRMHQTNYEATRQSAEQHACRKAHRIPRLAALFLRACKWFVRSIDEDEQTGGSGK